MNLPIKTTTWMRPANLIRKAALLGTLALAAIYGKAQTTAAQPSNIHDVILVHGAWADGILYLVESSAPEACKS